MMIIVGNRHFTHYKGRTSEPITCPGCGRTHAFTLNTRVSWFTVCFIPVFPYRFKRVCECPYCRCGLKFERADYDALLKTKRNDRIRHL